MSMKAAIDIDGTLTAWPQVLVPLTRTLVAAGWDLVLLTGYSCPDPAAADMASLVQSRRKQVAPLYAKFQDIIVCVGRHSGEVAIQKGLYLQREKVDLFIDDSGDYCEAARRLSPGTLTLQLYK